MRLYFSLLISNQYPLSLYRVNLMVVGDKAFVKTRPWSKGEKRVDCEVIGDAIRLVGKEGSLYTGYIFEFKAVKPGDSIIIEKILDYGKGAHTVKIFKFKVKVFSKDSLKRVSISSIAADPYKYQNTLFIISGISCGWGHPLKAKTVWGKMVTRSDWIIEDETGAAFVKGPPLTLERKNLTFVGSVVVLRQGGWILAVHKILDK